ncbi:MAG: hypothetical protein GF331_21300 [Chitinivibrionales bacterium]|nr:hypothetical protein [Chitinivibrionales bacterium]
MIVDWHWISRTLQRADRYVDAIVWNQYLLEDIDDIGNYRAAIDSTNALIRRHDSDGVREPVLIGATNMRGGPYIEQVRQDGMYAAVWWASVLAECVATRISLLTYFSLRDFGPMRKGLLCEDATPKPVAEATAVVLNNVHSELRSYSSSHPGLKVIASSTRAGDTSSVVCVNTTLNPLLVSLSLPRSRTRRKEVAVHCLAGGFVRDMSPGSDGFVLEGRTLSRFALAPRSITAVSLRPALPDPARSER